ncbi:MAG: glycosyltransferase family 1 protein, partial [Cyanobacteria bacterium P01_G01_bin.49]
MFKVCVDGTPIRGKLTGIGVYTLNLINALSELQETENFTLDIYFHPSVKKWLLRKSETPELLSQYSQVTRFPLPVSVVSVVGEYALPLLSYCDQYLDQPNIIHGTDHYVYPHHKSAKVMTIH